MICRDETVWEPPLRLIVNAGQDGDSLRREVELCARRGLDESLAAEPGTIIIVTAGRFVAAALRDDARQICITLTLPSARQPNDIAGRLKAHLRLLHLFLAQWSARQQLARMVGGLTRFVEHNAVATLLLGVDGEVRFANIAARRLMQEADGICCRNGRIACGGASDTARLLALLARFDREGGDPNIPPVLMVARKRRRPLFVILSAAKGLEMMGDDAAVAAYVTDPEQDLRENIRPACRLYGLSPGETKLVCALVAGSSLQDAAKAQRVQEQTARSYLKHVFLKTETKRQAELIHLMLKSAVNVVMPASRIDVQPNSYPHTRV